MKKHYTVDKNNITTIHYSFTDLRNFLTLGYRYGNTGCLLVSINNNTKTLKYKGFGTIENPCFNINTIEMRHLEVFDGEFPSIEVLTKREVIEYKIPISSYEFKLIDMNEYNGECTVKKVNK